MKSIQYICLLFLTIGLFACPSPQEPVLPFILVDLIDQDGFSAPQADTLIVTTSAIVGGNPISKDITIDAPSHALPTSFVIRFSEGVRGNTVDIVVRGFAGGAEVYTAVTNGVAGTDSVEAVAHFCGDGTTDQIRAEACDDGALNSDTAPDACRTSCAIAGCGDGVLDAGEQCDDGANNSDTLADACRTSCQPAFCGDGVLDAGEQCDDGVNNSDTAPNACRTSCEAAICGDGVTDTGEECDDANAINSDGCDNDCIKTTVLQLAAGGSHMCALLRGGNVRCWGDGGNGQLGYGNLADIGDDETPASAGTVDVGGVVVQLAAGDLHTCALLDTGNVRCWGSNRFGALGYGANVGGAEIPSNLGDVNVGGLVNQITAGANHTCGLLTNGKVRCWGNNSSGQLGYANNVAIGDDEEPVTAGDIFLGATAAEVTSGAGCSHTCARLNNNKIRCWGNLRYPLKAEKMRRIDSLREL